MNAQPVPQVPIIPTAAASWFDPKAVHDIEKLSLPHFFEQNGESDTAYAQEYIRSRDYMINSYQADPTEYLTVLACTKDLNGDLEDLIRIHGFLEDWGLINFQVSKPMAIQALLLIDINRPLSIHQWIRLTLASDRLIPV